MKLGAFILFVVGVIITSCFAARPVSPRGTGPKGIVTSGDRIWAWADEAGAPFAAGLVLMIAGGLIARRRKKPTESQSGATKSDELFDTPAALEAISAIVSELDEDGDARAEQPAIRATLDRLLDEAIPELLTHRQAMIDTLGLGRFAEMIGQFAGMERNIARAWSALTDEAYGEVGPSIRRAKQFLENARNSLGTAP